MNTGLRVLYLTHHGPWPAASGGRLRDAALIPEVARLADLEVWAVSRTPDADRAASRHAPAGVVMRVFADESTQRSYPTRDSAVLRAALAERLSGPDPFDVIHVEGHYLFHLLPEGVQDRAVVVEHNVESHLLQQMAAHCGLTPRLMADIETLASAEEQVWRAAGMMLALSREDQARILARVPDADVRVSTNGADHAPQGSLPATDGLSPRRPVFGFLANYSYPPNGDALGWLLDEIFPALRARRPGCRLVLVGLNLFQSIDARQPWPPGVETWGWLDDLSAFWSRIDVLLCPLRIGGGIKVKLIEAVRAGALAVSTSVGLEGLGAVVREAIVRADDATDVAEAAIRLVSDQSLRESQRARIARAQQALPSWQDVAATLHGYWLSVSRPVLGGIVG